MSHNKHVHESLMSPVKRKILQVLLQEDNLFYGDIVKRSGMEQNTVLRNLIELKQDAVLIKNKNPSTFTINSTYRKEIKKMFKEKTYNKPKFKIMEKIKNLFVMSMLMAIVMLMTYTANGQDKEVEKGVIVFDTEQISKTEAVKPAKVKTFDLTDDIYGRIFLAKPLADYYNELGYDYQYDNEKYAYNYGIRIKVNGLIMVQYLDELIPKDLFYNKLSFDFALSPSGEMERNFAVVQEDWVEIIKRLEEGTHEVKIELLPYHKDNIDGYVEVIASGKFKINVDKDKMSEFLSKNFVGLPMPTMSNEEIEQKIEDATIHIYYGMEPIDAIIVDKDADWDYMVDNHGMIMARTIVAAVVLQDKSANCYVKTGLYRQKHLGNGKFGKVFFSRKLDGFYDYQLSCDEVHKERSK